MLSRTPLAALASLLLLAAAAGCARLGFTAPGDAGPERASLERGGSIEAGPGLDRRAERAGGEGSLPGCGDKVCSASETCTGCPADCGSCGCGEVTCRAGVICKSGLTLTAPVTPSGIAAQSVADLNLATFALDRPAFIHVCGLDLAKVVYSGYNPYDRGGKDKGAVFGVGVGPPPSAPTDPLPSIWMVLYSAMTSTDKYCQAGPVSHDTGHRKYLIQTWRNGALSQLGAQYQVERATLVDPVKYAGTERLDLRMQITRTGASTYTYRAWVRLQTSSLKIDGCSTVSNPALNTATADAAWTSLKTPGSADYDTTPSMDLSHVSLIVLARNGLATASAPQVISYKALSFVPASP